MTILNKNTLSETIPSFVEAKRIEDVVRVVKQYYPALVPATLAELAVCGSMSLGNRTKPLSLIFEAGSGSGKTAVVQMVFPLDERLKDYVYRTDKFTPKSFVSHAANKKEEELRKQDLLPKIKDKVLVTKELAPIFRGRKEELTENFSMLISVLDGKGFTSDSGMRGQRGYQEGILFNWIGATTPIPRETHRLMSQLGTRLLFYEVPSLELTEDELLAYAERDDSSEAENECARVVNEFLAEFYEKHPRGSVNPEDVLMSQALARELVRWAGLLVRGRAEVKYEREIYGSSEAVAALAPESPFRVIGYFKDLARGHALIHGRMEVDESDLELISHIAISSIPSQLRPLIRELRQSGGVNSSQGAAICGVSQPTARRYLRELSLLGFVELTKGNPLDNQADEISLNRSFQWLKIKP